MRIACFSDVHGNATALNAMLAAAEAREVDGYWATGDHVAHGPHPGVTVRRLMALPGLRAVRGNTDRYALTGDLSPYIPADDPATRLQAARSLGWTLGAVSAAGGYDWLSGLPVEERLTLPSGERVLMVHAAPGLDDGPGLYPEMTDRELLEGGVAASDADVIFVGHTHVPMDRTVAGVRVVNLGSVSNPVGCDKRATWTLLDADAGGYRLETHHSAYDLASVRSDLDEVHHPGAAWLKRKFFDGAP